MIESGTHKVVRVPKTETKGRLHSSTVTVTVLPQVPLDFQINPKDLKFEYTTS
jgi:peptide chain release factor 1